MHRSMILVLLVVIGVGSLIACGRSSDDAITSAVLKKYESDTTIPVAAIDVRTRDGVVTLSGVIYGQAVADKAIQLALSVPGVNRVDSKMTITAYPKPTSGQSAAAR